MNRSTASSSKKPIANPLELLRDSATSLKTDLVKPMPEEALRQIFGRTSAKDKKISGELKIGASVEISEIITGKKGEESRVNEKIEFEARLRREDDLLVSRRLNELRLQIHAIKEEITKAVKATVDLSEELKIAAFEEPLEATEHEARRLDKLLEAIMSYRKKIQKASVWLHSVNQRRAKKNMWGSNYKKHGAKYLLSSEHYLQRSAG